MSDMNHLFVLDDKQQKKAKKWMEETSKDNAYTGAIGGRFEFRFTITSIGVGVAVYDHVTKKELDITDYDNW